MERLVAHGLSDRRAKHAAGLYATFVAQYAGTNDADQLRDAWNRSIRRACAGAPDRRRWCETHRWTVGYRRRALGALLRALELERPEWARWLNPRAKRRRGRRVETGSSHETTFYLHDCLPLAVRLGPAGAPAYRLLIRVAEGLLRGMRSACRHTLQKRMLFVYRLMGQEPSLLTVDDWERVCATPAAEWVRRFEAGWRPGSVCPRTFHTYLTTLRTLYGEVFGTHADAIPGVGGAGGSGTTVVHDDDDDGTSDDAEVTDGGEGTLRTRLVRLRARLCRPTTAPERLSFTPEEVTALIDRALSNVERLVVMLLITTGLRIGGLCRLRWRTAGMRREWGHEIAVDALQTVEKGNRPRTLVLLAPVRMLLARYVREDRPNQEDSRLFPTTGGGTMHPANMRKILQTVFRRAGICGRHAHPHTFRHTYVHMMRLLGVEADLIAKMVGHANLATTERVYSRYHQDELVALTASVPIFGGSVASERTGLKERWRRVVQRINRPYEFSEREWQHLT